MSGEHKQDYVCSLCCEGHHDRCLGDTDNRCDCVDCYRAEVERLRELLREARNEWLDSVCDEDFEYATDEGCAFAARIDAALDAKGVE